jgi:hypothetical protein
MGNAAVEKIILARDVLADLYELVEAIDRRIPQTDRFGETQIAVDAARIRERAVRLIQRIEGNTPQE